ncbi:MAG: penicillin acylase family protein [Bacteroidia bacterium]|nr:penicillin acylase family protein [Bacteroidia bacterium]MDW8157446.1 penicillin acylase family protein [Bacteroidia bacterium]
MHKNYLITIIIILLLPTYIHSQISDYPPIDPRKITIARDTFGIPHVFAPTDREVAYGLAWAYAEDRFETLQDALILARCRQAEIRGLKGITRDFFVQWVKAREIAHKEYHLLGEDFKPILNGYVQGLNAYAAKYPKKVLLKNLFPINEIDLLAGLVTILSGMVGLADALKFTLKGKPDEYIQRPGESNGFAIKSTFSKEGKTYLCINPHMPFEGTITFYEAHVCSDEGWNILGGFMPGMVGPGIGCNGHLAWTHTFNWPDYVDIYKLNMHPQNKKLYRFDGVWHALEISKARFKIKIGPFLIPISKNIYYSVYGPVIKSKRIYYTFRYSQNKPVLALEQWYRMGKAQNLQEYKAAMRYQSIPLFNCIYADKEDNIYYLFNGLIPIRNEKFNWQKCLIGDTSANRWTRYLSFEELPQIENPKCGYIYNTNNPPFKATCEKENLSYENYPENAAFYWNRENNRDFRFRELIQNKTSLSLEELKAIKYDIQYPSYGPIHRTISNIQNLDTSKYPKIKEGIKIIQNWNLRGDAENKQAAFTLVTFYEIFKIMGAGFLELETGLDVPTQIAIKGIKRAQRKMRRYYGSLEVPLKEVQKVFRGNLALPLQGVPEGLAPVYTQQSKKSLLHVIGGDNYTAFITFSNGKLEKIESISPYGASYDPKSPHYSDQTPLFVKNKTKIMQIEKAKVLSTATQIYSPSPQ